MSSKTKLFFNIFAIVALSIAIAFVYKEGLAWTSPTINPPGGSGVLKADNGNVGIGTTAPSAPLTVSGQNAPWRGQLMVKDTTPGNNADAYMSFWSGSETGSGNTGLLGYVGFVSDSDNNMSVGNYPAGGPLLLNQWGGNVGIGTTAPSTGLKLDVAGKVGATEYCDQDGNNCKTITAMAGGTPTIEYGSCYVNPQSYVNYFKACEWRVCVGATCSAWKTGYDRIVTPYSGAGGW